MSRKLIIDNDKLNKLLLEKGMNKSMLAKKSGITPNYIYQIILGVRSPSNKTAGAIAKTLGTPVTDIFFTNHVSKSTTKSEAI
ncbi:helix-turn-helix transcriptional regulator [Fructilactobacillus frigidiflavus]|uniref:helix-turn-helix transcriptional regulator n=1 Tax=Fructilactobacillus frigidiflavus TaxID=3242688 RepID=UPI00375660EF